jgi:hypothetical protein
MKKLFLLLALASSAHAQTFPYSFFYAFSGPSTLIAGSRTAEAIRPGRGFNWTVNASTDVFTITTSGATVSNGDLVQFEETLGQVGWTTSTLPAGMFGMVNGVRATYATCNVAGGGTTFQLKYNSTPISGQQPTPSCSDTTTLNVTNTGTGTQIARLIFRSGDNTYLNADPTGYPSGTTFTYKVPIIDNECGQTAPTSNGKVYSPGGGQLCIFATIPSGATTGATTVSYVICGTDTGTNCTTLTYAKNVIAPPTITYTPPSSPPAFSKTAWEQMMIARPCPGSACGSPSDPTTLSGPANYADPLASPSPVTQLGAGTGFGVSFYGWNLLFDNIAIYTGNPIYRTGPFLTGMGHSGASDLQSVRYYVTNSAVGNPPGYATFTESLFRAARVFGDSTYSDAALLINSNFFFAQASFPGFSLLRENTFGLNTAVDAFAYGHVTNAHWADLRDQVYSFVLRASESDASGLRFPQQGFMLALATHALIHDWQISGDPRAELTSKRAWDYLYAHYDATSHAAMNIEGPSLSPWCADDMSAADWFTPGDGGSGCGLHPLAYQELQAMLVHMAFWYYAMTGDTTYQTQGDEMWAHFIDNTAVTGKSDSQMYYDSFNSVGWRTGTLSPTAWYGDAVAVSANRNFGGARISSASRH